MKTCAMCKRTSDDLDSWFTVVHQSLIGLPDEWQEVSRTEVCSWACLRLAYMAEEPGEPPSPERWKGEGN